jgi:uncharacterized glyoxalase superfamily protein PhnB
MSGVASRSPRRRNTRHSGTPIHRADDGHRMPPATATGSDAATMVSVMSAKAAAIGIVVADLPVSVAFYEHFDLIFTGVGTGSGSGASTEASTDAAAHGHAEADLGDGLRLILDTEESIKSFTSAWTRPFGSPRTTVCFQFETPRDVDAKFAELMEAGYHGLRGPWDAPWGQRYASVIDPDGSGVDLFARL